MEEQYYDKFEEILLEDLQQALGCTEPIAIALCAAKAKSILNKVPTKVILHCSKNIIKNAKSVTVPNSNGLKGIEVAAALGIVGGNSDKNLKVLEDITESNIEEAKKLIASKIFTIEIADVPNLLYIRTELIFENDVVSVEIKDRHSNISKITKNKEVIYSSEDDSSGDNQECDKSLLNIHSIIEFADSVDLSKRKELTNRLDLQIECNTNISKEGLSGKYGAGIGHIISETSFETDIKSEVKACTTAASDARMGGCGLPVVINSGSGNQGITTSLPVITYAKSINASKDKLYRALIVANLTTIHQKQFIGKLSAFCGVVSAGAAAGCGIGYLMGLNEEQIEKVLVNTLATSGGIVCDGAKPSCALKIAVALENAFLAIDMAKRDIVFDSGDGIVGENVEKTIENIGRMASVGMKNTDDEILNIMIGK
ncbi:serine dehydratase subunit alpha family protein [Miniphocaeibacter halophilus]|uniref:Serine dehydratase subunit alpha family protein n=1 Tax=Miniphocaeibacter halophilus TaxID=2931922 RepID=A0AC61MTP9_9FIRM|nr:L-serine ammonia-lyase, iron-sulfur-dependent, subunit alpha [Miniphocaeibacter halophilus]QQK08743.1 serine dehydratase subunit alpha family protein [Miniphocaeibacter halophilus]